ncbi:MAG: cation diffusion facilitator family transporter [Anaerovoracaceae bacterium]|jgi:cation diffusion facilitator family transporter
MVVESNNTATEREKKIIRVSTTGIIANFILAAVKIVIGLFSGSIAIISDAVNNMTDSASSFITIIGTKLANMPPSKDHPFGYGRIEYITSIIIGIILLYTGVQMMASSIKKIIHPEELHYSVVMLVVIAATIGVKIFLSRYTANAGKKYNSGALAASGADARNDAIISAMTFISAIIYMATGVSIDAWASAAISIFIIKTGFDVFVDMHGHFLGQRADKKLSAEIYNDVRKCPYVLGAHDLILHDYGPDRMTGSINVEVDHSLSIGEIFPELHKVQMHILKEHMTYVVFGLYAVDIDHEESKEVAALLEKIKSENSHMLGYHGIDVDSDIHTIFCDVTLDFDCDRESIYKYITNEIQKLYPDYTVFVSVDTEFA